MPTLARFANCKICVHAADHAPPHFHIVASDGCEALVEIATLTVLRGQLRGAAMQQAMRWARTHQTDIQSAWEALNV